MTLLGFVDCDRRFIVSLAAVVPGSTSCFFGGLTPVEKKRVGVIAVCFLAAAVFLVGLRAGRLVDESVRRAADRSACSSAGRCRRAGCSRSTRCSSSCSRRCSARCGSGSARATRRFPRRWRVRAHAARPRVRGDGLGLGVRRRSENPVSPSWLVVTYFFHTTGELCLSPIGLSSITKLSPARYVGQMMGIWFMGSALGNLVAGPRGRAHRIAAAAAALRRASRSSRSAPACCCSCSPSRSGRWRAM